MTATVLALASALLHAGWNLIVKRSGDRLLAMWAQFAIAGLALVPVLLVVGPPPPAAYPFLALSALLQSAYGLALSRAYGTGDLSVTYPVARGLSPLLTAAGAALLLDDPLPAGGYLGVALACGGLAWIAWRGGRPRGLGWALVAGTLISCYTLSDAAGVRASPDALPYIAALFVAAALVLTVVVATRRSPAQVAAALRATPGLHLLNGLCAGTAYALVLVALRIAPAAYVATLRETSVVFAVLAGWLLLREPFGAPRLAGALGVLAGIALLTASTAF